MRTKLFIIITAAYLITCFTGCKKNEQALDNLDKEAQAYVKIASDKYVSEGNNLEAANVYYDKDNIEWTKKWSSIKQESPDYAKRLDVLENSKFQAIKFSRKGNNVAGGLLWVFIDKEDKNIITIYGEM